MITPTLFSGGSVYPVCCAGACSPCWHQVDTGLALFFVTIHLAGVCVSTVVDRACWIEHAGSSVLDRAMGHGDAVQTGRLAISPGAQGVAQAGCRSASCR